jgi:hypothetical protein
MPLRGAMRAGPCPCPLVPTAAAAAAVPAAEGAKDGLHLADSLAVTCWQVGMTGSKGKQGQQ